MKRRADGSISQRPKKKKKTVETGMRRQARNLGALAISKPEVKNSDVSSGTLTLNLADSFSLLGPLLINGIAGGTTRTARLGGSLSMTKIQLRLTCYAASLFPDLRVVIVYDHQPQGALPAVTDIFSADSFNAFMNISNSDRFLVLADEFLKTKNGYDPTSSTNSVAMSMFRKLPKPGLISKYLNSNTGTIADITSGAVYVLLACAATSVNPSLSIRFNSRVRFTDA